MELCPLADDAGNSVQAGGPRALGGMGKQDAVHAMRGQDDAIPVSEPTEKMLRGPFISDYIQGRGVPLEHVRAAALLVDHCIASTTETSSGEQIRLYPEGYHGQVFKCWVEEEECKGFFNILARHAKELAEVIDPFDGWRYEVPDALWRDVERLFKAFICELRSRMKANKITRGFWC